MLACGEDLGMIPNCVHPVRYCVFFKIYVYIYIYLRNILFKCNNYINGIEMLICGGTTSMQVMQELGLIGLRIQRMPNEPGLEFGIPSQYSYMTVSSILKYIFFSVII